MVEIARILCPVDFSDASRHAIEHAIVVARWYGAALVGLHVHTPMYVPIGGLDLPDDGGTAFASPASSPRLRSQMEEAFAPAAAAGVPVEIMVTEGAPAAQILHDIRACRADLLVMGTHGASGFERLLLGSVTEKVVRKAGCPVLTVPPKAHARSSLPFKRILCPVDFSQASLAALQFALSLAQEADADLALLHVMEWPAGYEPARLSAFDVPQYTAAREKDAAEALDRLIPDAARDWCQASTHLAHGKAYEQVLSLARETGVDLIVIGVHGRNVWDLALFGSTTNQVIRGAACPVLTVRK
jgi:nucleotide-binding universal stress UspA family protein